ncbi:MAG: hypothetical protein EXS18_05300 [Verrucomicrobiae bacterium]|nr:hypothetical protein [Verrucomicrobiae bacterium]
MPTLKAAAAAVPIAIEPSAAKPSPRQEAELRASALVLEAGQRLCLVSCDTLVVPGHVLEEATRQIVTVTGIPPANILITASHTHHAPCTIDILGFHRDEAFCDRLLASIVSAVSEATQTLDHGKPEQIEVEFLFSESQEATVGTNSRYLLKDGTTAWYAYPWEDVIRPTGPFDPDLPVFALRRKDGSLTSILFNHSVHNIGALTEGMLSPGFYGLAAQDINRRHGGTTLFLPGAFGSSHNTGVFGSTPNLHAVSTAECVYRITAAVEKGLRDAQRVPLDSVAVLKRRFAYRIREFDEAAEEATVTYWAEKYNPTGAEVTKKIFRAMRADMAPVQGEERQTWLQAIRLGNIALVGVPGEMFGALGLEIRRRSPFRYTYIIGLANDTIGYIADRASYQLGGYQLWAGWHSPSAPGTGEALVTQALEMLEELHSPAGM